MFLIQKANESTDWQLPLELSILQRIHRLPLINSFYVLRLDCLLSQNICIQNYLFIPRDSVLHSNVCAVDYSIHSPPEGKTEQIFLNLNESICAKKSYT